MADRGFIRPEGMLTKSGDMLTDVIATLCEEHSFLAVLDALIFFSGECWVGKRESLGSARTWGRIRRGLRRVSDEEKLALQGD
jgi:hypothetical protein